MGNYNKFLDFDKKYHNMIDNYNISNKGSPTMDESHKSMLWSSLQTQFPRNEKSMGSSQNKQNYIERT